MSDLISEIRKYIAKIYYTFTLVVGSQSVRSDNFVNECVNCILSIFTKNFF